MRPSTDELLLFPGLINTNLRVIADLCPSKQTEIPPVLSFSPVSSLPLPPPGHRHRLSLNCSHRACWRLLGDTLYRTALHSTVDRRPYSLGYADIRHTLSEIVSKGALDCRHDRQR